MSDLLEPLRRVEPVEPPAPDVVRRRGDTIRRRRHAWQAAGAAAAVAAAVVAGSVLVTGTPGALRPDPPVATRTDAPQRTLGVNLTEGWPDPGTDGTFDRTAQEFGFIDYCGRTVWKSGGARERATAVLDAPEDVRRRELLDLGSASEAGKAFDRFREGTRACAAADPGAQAPPGERWAFDVGRLGLGQRAVTLNGFSPDGAPGSETTLVTQVGRYVLLSQQSNEATRDDAARLLYDDAANLRDLVFRLCEEEGVGCQVLGRRPADSTASGEAFPPSTAPVLSLDDVRAATSALDLARFKRVADTAAPTLACQSDWLRTLEPTRMSYREFASRRDGRVSSRVATAVLDFEDAAGAATARDTVRGWLADCATPLDSPHPPAQVSKVKRSPGDPSFEYVETVAAAPEVCTECDSGWLDAQAVAAVDDHLILTSVGYLGDLQVERIDLIDQVMGQAISTAVVP